MLFDSVSNPAFWAAISQPGMIAADLIDFRFPGNRLSLTNADIRIPSVVEAGEGPVNFKPGSYRIPELTHNLGMTIDSMTVRLDDANHVLGAALLGIDSRGSDMACYIAVLNGDGVPQAVQRIWAGTTDTVKGDKTGSTISVEVFNPLIFRHRKTPRRTHQVSCYKTDPGVCPYAGQCAKTWAACEDFSNTVRFGGFRWLADLELKEIWWGRAPR